jgi:hypothetical protein
MRTLVLVLGAMAMVATTACGPGLTHRQGAAAPTVSKTSLTSARITPIDGESFVVDMKLDDTFDFPDPWGPKADIDIDTTNPYDPPVAKAPATTGVPMEIPSEIPAERE